MIFKLYYIDKIKNNLLIEIIIFNSFLCLQC